MPRGRPKKNLTVIATKPEKTISEVYNALDFDHTGTVKANPRNLFEEWGLQNEAKEDVKIDKKLNKNKKPSPRRKAVKTVQVICPLCKRQTDILDNLVDNYCFEIPNNGTVPTFRCDRCMGI